MLGDVAELGSQNRKRITLLPSGLDEAAAEHSLAAIDFCDKALKPGGVFILKTFQGGAFDEVLQRLKHDFGKVNVRKPEASRGESKETYVVARNPRKMDPLQSPQKTGVSP